MSLFSRVSAFHLFIMNFVACASINGKTITITILSTKTEIATVFMTPANKINKWEGAVLAKLNLQVKLQ